MTFGSCEAVILAGGQSKRMGTNKALLPREGKRMLAYIYDQLSDFSACCLSSNDPILDEYLDIPVVRDVYGKCGPLGGIHAAMLHSNKEAVFVVPCDFPFFSAEIPRLMLEAFSEEWDAIVCVDAEGMVHPLCGIYQCNILGVLESQLQQGDYRVRHLLDKLKWKQFCVKEYLSDQVLFNMNTLEEYHKMQEILSDDD